MSQSPTPAQPGEPVLSDQVQWRNSLVFLLNTSLSYLVAPVFYIGVLHAAILDRLEASRTVANLPETVYQWVMPLPVLISWLWPSPRLLRPMLMTALGLLAAAGLFLASMFYWAPREWLVIGIIVHAAVVGVTNGVRQMCLWELLGRGLSPERRAWTLGFTFGLGPIFAVLGSLASQLVLSGNFLDVVQWKPVPSPWSYMLLFGATGPAMLLAAGLVLLAQVPPAPEPRADGRMADIAQGLRAYFLHPLILITAAAFLLTHAGPMVMTNLALFVRDALGEDPERYAGLQLALRFSCKAVVGFGLGWLVARVNARASLFVTTLVSLLGVVWAMVVPGRWYMLSFGFLGAGELFYIYYLNYIIGCAPPERLRETTAYTNLIAGLAGFIGLLFGLVGDRYGLQTSFSLAVGLFLAALVLVTRLPPQPRLAGPPSP
ncbi:MAG: hypothetical protein U0840_00575 [Gemmataceae bacterium]